MANAPSSLPSLGRARLAFELARAPLLFTAFVVLAAQELWLLAVPAALGTFLAAFVLLHDAMHNALGLSRPANEVVLTLSGVLLLKSGHGLRATHLRHHGRTLRDDDPEGGVVHWPLWRIVLAGPFHVLGNRALSMRVSPPTRRHQLVETALTVLAIALAVGLFAATGSPAGLVYWAVAATLSATMSIWAAYLPHVLSARHPLVRAAAGLSRWWTPVVSSFAFHHLHHQFPRVPTALLSDLAREVGPDIAFADDTLHHG
jgi:fatty acid desaturase